MATPKLLLNLSSWFSIALFCAPMFAAAGSGYSLATVAVKPLDVPAVVTATDKMMASAAGQKFKGRLLLLQRIADGSDPSTLSIVSIVSIYK